MSQLIQDSQEEINYLEFAVTKFLRSNSVHRGKNCLCGHPGEDRRRADTSEFSFELPYKEPGTRARKNDFDTLF